MIERRVYPRMKASLPVLYSSDIYFRPRVGSTLNLSIGGTRIETPYSVIKGERLRISIAIPPQGIKCRGKVVHISWLDGEKLKAGVRFEDLSKHDRICLREYIFSVMEQRKGEKESTTSGSRKRKH